MTRDPVALAGSVKRIALIGASNKPERPSYRVMAFLLARGYTVFPVNPGLVGQSIQGQPVYASLEACPPPIDMVDIFRATEAAESVIETAIESKDTLGIQAIWCQLGVLPYKAAARAEKAGLTVIMDRCPAIEWR